MLVIPAIDIRGGRCVRLRQGDFSQMTIYSDDPVEVALDFVSQGAEMLHIVDLDAAESGQPTNTDVLKRILTKTRIPLQFGGGIRSKDWAKELLDEGVERVVLGSAAHSNLKLMAELCKQFGSRVVAAVDGRAGNVSIHGWKDSTSTSVVTAVNTLRDVGVEEFLYTDIVRDGMLTGPDFAGLEDILRTGARVIASGGISSLEDLSQLLGLSPLGITGVIVGKALYEGVFTLEEAMLQVNGGRTSAR